VFVKTSGDRQGLVSQRRAIVARTSRNIPTYIAAALAFPYWNRCHAAHCERSALVTNVIKRFT
jgi:hypothetical protein